MLTRDEEFNYKADPRLPVINFRTKEDPAYVLAELCDILPGQSVKAKLSPDNQDAMIQFACRSPVDNATSITTAGRQLLALDNNDLLTKFGIGVDKQLITVKGRELPAPAIAYLSKSKQGFQPVTPETGSWLMKDVKVVKSCRPIKNWDFIHFTNPTGNNVISDTVVKFAGFMANNMGMNIVPKPMSKNGVSAGSNPQTLQSSFAALAQKKPQLIVVVLPKKDTDIYQMVKHLGDVEHGIQTVCVVQTKFTDFKGQMGYFCNVGLKVNLKFGGVNHKLQVDNPLIKSGKTMIAGYDVTHPTNLAPGVADHAPSFVGLVASIDKDLSQYPAHIWSVKGKIEVQKGDDGLDAKQSAVKETLVEGFKTRLRLWQRNNASGLPDNIIIFRDGVSEGQFNLVLQHELPSIRKACAEMYGAKSNPRISLLVSVKRHQTRFYPTDQDHIHFKSKSPKEGTVVDRGVTNVRYWDFFLQAHASIQGKQFRFSPSIFELSATWCRQMLYISC